MRYKHPTIRLAAALTAIIASACGTDNATAPAVSGRRPDEAATHALLSAPVTVNALQRRAPLASPIRVSKNIGILGGAISVPDAGFTVVVPALAVSKTTTITVTALAGGAVAYEFEPAGTNFLVPLVATQDLTKTNTSGLNLSLLTAGYFKSAADINQATGTATVSELLSVNVSLLSTATFTITHFSGYILASGRSSSDE